MSLVTTAQSSVILWKDLIKSAENRCSITLSEHLESYLIALLHRYTNKPELVQQILAQAFLEAMQMRRNERQVSLQIVGDQCLLYAGLFPGAAQRKHVKVKYFVDLGRSAYANVSKKANDLFWSLAIEFVALMDVLQTMRDYSDLLPLEAYEQWEELGSKRALHILKTYSNAIPFKKNNN